MMNKMSPANLELLLLFLEKSEAPTMSIMDETMYPRLPAMRKNPRQLNMDLLALDIPVISDSSLKKLPKSKKEKEMMNKMPPALLDRFTPPTTKEAPMIPNTAAVIHNKFPITFNTFVTTLLPFC